MAVQQFIEERINEFVETVSLETVGGPQFSTTIVATSAGIESANVNWQQERGRWEFGERVFDQAELRELGAFFRRVRGKAVGFRFKDFSDCDIDTFSSGTLVPTQEPLVFEMYKTYGDDNSSYSRRIYKPVEGTINVFVDGVEAEAFVDYETGTVEFGTSVGDGELSWSGEFDVPVRFDVDQLQSRFDAYEEDGERLFYVFSLPVVEIRL
jgi:uncharacterized protein (TIGR02217 family)